MMETNLPDSGFLTCFYYTGRHTTDFACGWKKRCAPRPPATPPSPRPPRTP